VTQSILLQLAGVYVHPALGVYGVAAMSWFDFLKRQKKQQAKASLPPIRTVQEPGAVRRERLAREDAEAAAAAPSPEEAERARRESELFDTGSLEMAREAGDGDNPYDTQSWQVDTPQATRRVDDLKAINRERKSGSQENPYDTPIKRKGW